MPTTVEDFRSVDHAIAVPVSDEQHWELSAAFVAHGLTSGAQVIYFDDGTVSAVLERLADDGVATAGPIREGRLAVVPSEVTRAVQLSTPDEIGDTVRAAVDGALAAGYPGVHITGRLDHAVPRSTEHPITAYDRALDEVIRDRPVRLLCVYDRVRYPDEVVDLMRTVHHTEVSTPAIYDDGLLRITAVDAATARVAGEVDHSNQPRIRKLLEAALDKALRAPDAPRDITLDLSSLRFLDVAGSVGLVHAAEEFPSAHRLVLTGVRPRVQRILDRCGAPFAVQLDVRPRREPADEDVVDAPCSRASTGPAPSLARGIAAAPAPALRDVPAPDDAEPATAGAAETGATR